jgi:hypothetical protein
MARPIASSAGSSEPIHDSIRRAAQVYRANRRK